VDIFPATIMENLTVFSPEKAWIFARKDVAIKWVWESPSSTCSRMDTKTILGRGIGDGPADVDCANSKYRARPYQQGPRVLALDQSQTWLSTQ